MDEPTHQDAVPHLQQFFWVGLQGAFFADIFKDWFICDHAASGPALGYSRMRVITRLNITIAPDTVVES
ncbi:hypothetical protein [Nitrosomonas sp.]|uniref:hypothetical protein n=1 Tax=Nitrosomonas sp. TaxID=42353 RepID=UPI0025EFD117|nr:hypothetical protein [Nitrosomonas sp.]